MKWIQKLVTWIKKRLYHKTRITALFVEDLPDVLKERKIYLLGEEDFLWSAAMICPCGCKSVLQMNLLPDASPKWTVEEHPNGTVTVVPSIWRKVGCRSHFFIRNGKILWCEK